MSKTEKRERFGRYLILDHLVDGGMAKICRARFLGEQADKVVAIKMVQEQFSADPAFKQMFMDEIKVGFGLQHPNIVQTFDYGLQEGQLFVAMEYCDGRNLKEYFDKLRKRRFVFPVEISTFIISQVCQGLHYAHTLTDKLSGKKYNIVHRDISPHNIMLTFDGSIKVIDFGIAKAETNSEKTQAGTIKGKLSYLAPEYLEGMELDARYDEFAVGITLWEMLCSRKLFKANNDLAVLKKIQECYVPAPSEINPHVPKELDEIVLKALSKDREHRYKDLDQLNRALMKFLYSTYPDFNATDLSYFAKELFKEEIEEDRKKLFEFGKIDIKPYLEELKKEQLRGTQKDNTKTISPVIPLPVRERGNTEISLDMKKSEIDIYLKKSRKEKANENISVSERNVGDKTSIRVSRNGRTRTIITHARTAARTNSVRTNRAKKRGLPVLPILFLASCMMFMVVGPTKVLTMMRDVPVLQSMVGKNKIKREVASNQNGKGGSVSEKFEKSRLKIRLIDLVKHKDKVFLDGVETKPDFLGQIEVPRFKRTVLRIERSGHEHFIKMIERDTKRKVIKLISTPEAGYGYLKTSRNCVRGVITFTIFGEAREEKVPLSNPVGIPFPLNYDNIGKSVKTEFTIGLKRRNEKLTRTIKFSISNEFDSVDICSLI